jgi:signal transducer and activator of transcription 5B
MHDDNLPRLNQQITSILSTLITSTFVIERQPPQVLKVKFSILNRSP